MRRERESAVSLPVPEAEALVGAWRQRFDRSASVGVPAHITLLYPFLPPAQIGAGDVERLAAVFADTPATAFSLVAVRRFPAVLYLAPEPDAFFRGLMSRIWSLYPQTPPYGGAFQEVIPHLTVAQADDPAVLDEVEAAVSPRLPVAARAAEAWLEVEGDDDRWSVRQRFPLRGA